MYFSIASINYYIVLINKSINVLINKTFVLMSMSSNTFSQSIRYNNKKNKQLDDRANSRVNLTNKLFH